MGRPPRPLSDSAPFVPWAELPMGWELGEHVTIIGPTNCGKTTIALDLMQRRKYGLIIVTKPEGADRTVSPMLWRRDWRHPLTPPPVDAWVKIKSGLPAHGQHRGVLWPGLRSIHSTGRQAAIIDGALGQAFVDKNWTVFADETNYITDTLRLGATLKLLWRQGRSLGISLVTALQRPRHAPLEAYDQATHLFLFRSTDADARKRLADIGGSVDPDTIRDSVARLGQHEVLYVNTRDGTVVRTKQE